MAPGAQEEDFSRPPLRPSFDKNIRKKSKIATREIQSSKRPEGRELRCNLSDSYIKPSESAHWALTKRVNIKHKFICGLVKHYYGFCLFFGQKSYILALINILACLLLQLNI